MYTGFSEKKLIISETEIVNQKKSCLAYMSRIHFKTIRLRESVIHDRVLVHFILKLDRRVKCMFLFLLKNSGTKKK